MARVPIRGVTLNVVEAGRGTPLVLLHGFTGNAARWAPFAAAAQRRFRTIAVDLLGHGESDAPADPARYAMKEVVEDLATLLDEFGVERGALVGYSMGGRVALAFAIDHPERVSALALEGASPGIAEPDERAARRAQDRALADRIERDGVEAFVDHWMQQPLFATQARLGPAALAKVRAARCANSALGLANSLRGLGVGNQDPLWDRLPRIAAPTLLVVGEDDLKFHSIALAMAERIRGAAVAVIPRAGHTTHLENPDAFRDRVLEFLDTNAVGPQRSVARAEHGP